MTGADEDLMHRLYLLRATPQGKAARKAISASTAQALSAIIDRSVQFRDARAKRRFGPGLRWWAFVWINYRDEALPLQERKKVHLHRRELTTLEKRGVAPSSSIKEIRTALKSFAKTAESAQHAVGVLERALAGMGTHAYAALRPSLTWPYGHVSAKATEEIHCSDGTIAVAVEEISRQNELRRAWLRAIESEFQQLALLRRSVEHSLENIRPKKGANVRSLHNGAIEDLWRLWADATGDHPARDNERTGPFYAFVPAAMKLLWPKAPSPTGLIDHVCTRMRASAT